MSTNYLKTSTESSMKEDTSKNVSLYTEKWKPIRGLERYYEVSSHGNVRTVPRIYRSGNRFVEREIKEKHIRQFISRRYKYVCLSIHDGEFRFIRSIPVHRLVAQEFCSNPLGRKEVNHKDGNKNNNHYSNLEWVSREENRRHARLLGLYKKNHIGSRKFSEEKILEVFELRKSGLTHKLIAKKLGMGISTVTHVLLGSRRAVRDKL